MQQSDFEGICSRGKAARQAGSGYYENPFYFANGSFEKWCECCSVWSAGWIKEDAGCDKALAHKLWQPLW